MVKFCVKKFSVNFMQLLSLIVLATCVLVSQMMIIVQNVVLIQTM